MKKLLVVLLALTFVVVMAAAAFAVTTTSVDGKVEWTMDNSAAFGGSVDGKVVFDLAKDFGEGYSAGLKIKLNPASNETVSTSWVEKKFVPGAQPANAIRKDLTEVADPITGTVTYLVPGKTDYVVDNDDAVAYDGDGWIKMVKDMYTLTLQTGGLGGNAANELGVGYDMAGNAGLKVESSALMEGLSTTLVLNDAFKTGGTKKEDDGNYYNYLIKAVYTADALTVGFGDQAHSEPAGKPATEKDMMAFWGSYKLSDALSFGLEYASRPNLNGKDENLQDVKGSTGIRVKADYTAGALTVNGKVQIQTGAFYNIDPDDKGDYSAFNFFQYGIPIGADNVDPEDGTGAAGTALKVDAKYQVTDAIAATLTVEDIMSGAVLGNGTKLTDKQLMSYKLDATDNLSEKLVGEVWYSGYGDKSELGAKATYTFAAGLVGYLQLTSDTDASKASNQTTNGYKVDITATL